MNDDAELLRRYAEERDEAAFAELVRRHVNLVYSVALRTVNGDAHLAADAVQVVFTDLARKALSLSRHRVLAGWLFTSARFAAAKLVRGEQRRHVREQEAHLMHVLDSNDDSAAQLDWERVRPVLDEVIGELAEPDREAILLRFFEGRDYASIGAKLNLADNTTRMRVDRALDKLRARLERRGVRSTSAALATALAQQAVAAAPAGLAATVTGAALAGGATLAGSAVVAGAGAAAVGTTFMNMATLQIGLAGAIAVAGVAGYVVQAKTNASLQEQVAALRRENTTLEALRVEQRKLAREAADVAEMRRDDAAFARVQQEAADLRGRLQQLAAAPAAPVSPVMLERTPTPTFQARPFYPAEPRRLGLSAEVLVDFVVDKNGDVQNVQPVRPAPDGEAQAVVKLSPFTVATTAVAGAILPDAGASAKYQGEFEAAAVQAVSKWKFKPGMKGGRDVNTHLQVPVVFTVSEK
jgi:RNA polymerase sigma factor (sigma-70 family)